MKYLLPIMGMLVLSIAACKKDNTTSNESIRYCPSVYALYKYANNGDTAFCFVPNVFTPDGDGLDDGFVAASWNIASLSTTVKDGNTVVFHTDSVGTEYWMGKINGVDAPMKNYDYTVSGTDVYGHLFTLTGKVSLVRMQFTSVEPIAGKVNCDSCRLVSHWSQYLEVDSFSPSFFEHFNVCEE